MQILSSVQLINEFFSVFNLSVTLVGTLIFNNCNHYKSKFFYKTLFYTKSLKTSDITKRKSICLIAAVQIN